MKRTKRLSCGQRRHAILEAVKRVFAAKGFDGTTTRELAQAAGVSEALLYKQVPSKGIADRLMVRSLLEDGELARISLEQFADAWLGKFEECLRAATKKGE